MGDTSAAFLFFWLCADREVHFLFSATLFSFLFTRLETTAFVNLGVFLTACEFCILERREAFGSIWFTILRRVRFVSLTRAAIKPVTHAIVVLGGVNWSITRRIATSLECFALVSGVAKNLSKTLYGVEGCFRGLYVRCFGFLPHFLLSRAYFSAIFAKTV